MSSGTHDSCIHVFTMQPWVLCIVCITGCHDVHCFHRDHNNVMTIVYTASPNYAIMNVSPCGDANQRTIKMDAIENGQNIPATVVPAQVEPAVKTQPRILPDTSAKKTAQPRMAKTIVALGAEDKAVRSMVMISPKKMRVSYTVRLSASNPTRYQMTSIFDFSKCSEEEFLQLAVATAVIAIQGKIRAGGDSGIKTTTYDTVDVKREVVETQRVQLDPDVRAIRALMAATGMNEATARATVVNAKAKHATKK